MSLSLYLDLLDERLRSGLAGLSGAFVETQVGFVARCQKPDGGFRGRQGDSDSYYTDFALRTLALLSPDHAAMEWAGGYHRAMTARPGSVVECFSRLNMGRLLKAAPCEMDTGGMIQVLRSHQIGEGGFGRSREDLRISAYNTFLGALGFQLLGKTMPNVEGAVRAVESLARADGGYAEMADQAMAQTSATAAAVGFLMMHGDVSSEHQAGVARYLGAMQSDDGGLRPHSGVGGGDLLSTFTGVVTLAGLDRLEAVDTAGIARFLRSVALVDGGFLACPGDDTADVEYAYYGIGALAILRSLAE